MIQVKEVIITDISRRGNGHDRTSPIRTVLEVYTKDGELLAINDSQGNYTIEQLFGFARLCRANPEGVLEEIYQSWSNQINKVYPDLNKFAEIEKKYKIE